MISLYNISGLTLNKKIWAEPIEVRHMSEMYILFSIARNIDSPEPQPFLRKISQTGA